MAKIWIEVGLISARGLRRSSSFWKLQWFAVGWIDPNNRYCTKIDASGNSNPTWKTKFATLVDESESNFNDLALHVEVYSREPLFLRERLQGTAVIVLKEFMAKHKQKDSERNGFGEVGSYQLRKGNSNKVQGFVDVSIHVSEEGTEASSFPDESGTITLATGDGSTQPSLGPQPSSSLQRPEHQPQSNFSYTHPDPLPFPTNYSNPSEAGPSYRPPRTPPPPPPPSHVGYIPTFIPRTDNLQETYINMPSSAGAGRGRGRGPGFAAGLGAGALAAGAVIYGDEFMSGFGVPLGNQDVSIGLSIDPPF